MEQGIPKKNLTNWLNRPWRLKPIYAIPVLVLSIVFIIIASQQLKVNRSAPFPAIHESYHVNDGPMYSMAFSERTLNEELGLTENLKGGSESTIERKIIYTASLEIEVNSADQAQTFALNYVQNEGGFVAETRRTVGSDERVQIRMVLRLPAKEFDKAILDFSALGKVFDQNIQGQDITEQYYDLETRLLTKEQQEERYLEILATATTVEEILKVERELERIRTEIESMRGTLRYYSDRTDLATITIVFQEPKKPNEVVSPLSEIFREISQAFLESLKGLLLFASYFAPWFVIVLLGVLIMRRLIRK